MGKRYGFLLKVMLLFMDLCLLNCCSLLAYWLIDLPANSWLLINLFICNSCWVLSAVFCKLYKSGARTTMRAITSRTVKTVIVNVSVQMLLFHFLKKAHLPHHVLLSIICSYSLLIIASRIFINNVLEFFIEKAKLQRKTAIVGYNNTGVQLANLLQQRKSMYSFEGFFDNPDTKYDGLLVDNKGKIVGSIDHCIDYAVKNDIREIYSTILPHQSVAMQKLMEVADKNCVRIRFVHDNNLSASTQHRIEYFLDELPVISLRSEPLQNFRNRLFKRAVDVAISGFALLFILSWLTPILAVIIKVQSPGPVFFKQQRSGKNNVPFWCYKFRSMTVNDKSDTLQATKNDPRVTPIGAFLRKSSLDEFPQFWNVFIGDMSIIGPRPHMLKHTEQYSAIINRYMIRQFLKPGITGWAQANGYRGETESVELMEKRVEHDIWYMENWSPNLDLKIFVRTLLSIFMREERAY
ncbi:undecaprenyl-phosphate glucose phosphotransferase [Ilyomonas limi]|uniref:Undecaprenyl-phosphate glucose phosphotransferase n=1 Tax=Ilyomonas limi TaxID=2575867 RepID=A0A4U3KZ41_9BACT|nr:undecaprenyl-phosphate glucose phosphotransferase [Ilyomonas limi]TKK67159.1 undecaprenyl-phosphate glucose phosphotransferase [Ilyomonas limi]